MPRVLTRSLALRVGWSHGNAAEAGPAGTPSPGRRSGFAELPLAGADNPWDFDAVLALAEGLERSDAPAEVMASLREALRRESVPEIPGDDLLPEVLSAAHVWAREPRPGPRPQVRLSFVCLRASRLWAAQAPALPVYLFRDDLLRPLLPDHPLPRSPHPEAGELEPEVACERLQDGDAVLLCTESIHESLSGRRVREILVHANGPETAARRLVSEARQEGARDPAAAVLFAGVGPAVAHRLRSRSAGLASPGGPAVSPRKERISVPLAVGAAALAGTLLGLGVGVWIGVLRPPSAPESAQAASLPPAAILPDQRPVIAPAAEPVAPTPPAPRLEAPAAAANAPANAPSAAPLTPAASNSPAPAAPAAPAHVMLQGSPTVRPAALPAEPPPHQLAPGLAAGMYLRLRVDPATAQLLLDSSQGALFSRDAPQGIPVGEALRLPAPQLLRDRPAGGELRLMAGDQAASALQDGALDRLLRGEPASLGPLQPGEYQLRWWDSVSGTLSGPITTFRLSGL